MTKTLFLFIALCLVASPLFSQEEETEYFPFQFSFFYPIGTSGTNSPEKDYSLSFNIISGITGSVNGFELGGLFNTNKKNMFGIQIGGIGNHTFGNVDAIQCGGIYNIVHHDVTGFQAGGLINLVGGESSGIQVAGIANLTGLDAQVQLGGVLNVADNISGLQVAGIENIADTVTGFQIAGLVNNATYVNGIQLAGLVNVCDSIDGLPIALFSYVKKNGYRRFEISSNETFYVNMGYKIGVKRFYTILQFGLNTDHSPYYSGIGVGAGTNYTLKNKLSVDVEAMSFYVQDNWSWEENNTLIVLRGHMAYNFSERLALYAGPSLNLLVAENHDDLENISPSWAGEIETPHNTDYHGAWVGFNAGIRF